MICFLDNDVFETLYEEAQDKFDIIGFKVFEGYNYIYKFNVVNNYASKRKHNLIINQPQLGIFPITREYKIYPNDI